MAEFEEGDVVVVTRDFKGARGWVGRRGVLRIHNNPMESVYDWIVALDDNDSDILYVDEEEIKHV